MTDLFSETHTKPPLADLMRPRSIDDLVGQSECLGPNGPLRLVMETGQVHSMILWGPPGVGKTTIARMMCDLADADFTQISAVFSGVKDIRSVVDRARMANQNSDKQMILFVDEVHRFNKSQQDAFLPFVESGLITFIGATTENPSFEVNKALLSRVSVYVFEPLDKNSLMTLFNRSMKLAFPDLSTDENVANMIVAYSDGDGRRLLNSIEVVAKKAIAEDSSVISEASVKSVLGSTNVRFDKRGDVFYEQISALHKSVRGSAPDASLYWLSRMLEGGADPKYIGRRLIRMATEDIGLADPRALGIAIHGMEAYERLGSPEGELALAEVAIYLASAPKSNSAYLAYNKARGIAKTAGSIDVPLHLRNASSKLMEELDYGKEYRYAHNEQGGYSAGQKYLPESLQDHVFYEPSSNGVEKKIKENMRYFKNRDRLFEDKKKK